MQELYNTLASKVYDVLAGYAQQQGYTLVLDVAQQQNPVLYANESSNITKQIIDAYNVKSGVPAPPAPPASARPAAARPAAPLTYPLMALRPMPQTACKIMAITTGLTPYITPTAAGVAHP